MDDPTPQPSGLPPGDVPTSESSAAPFLDYAVPNAAASLVRLRRFNSSTDANLARLKLDAEGIQAQLAGEARLNGIGVYGAVSGELELLVHPGDLDAATAILQAVDDRRAARFAVAAARMRCPGCRENDSRAYDTHRLATGVFLFAAGVVLLWLGVMQLAGIIAVMAAVYLMISAATNRRTCRRCGKRWLLNEEEPDDADEDVEKNTDGDEKESPGE